MNLLNKTLQQIIIDKMTYRQWNLKARPFKQFHTPSTMHILTWRYSRPVLYTYTADDYKSQNYWPVLHALISYLATDLLIYKL